MLDAFVAAEGEPEVVMLSGGEPTIHPDILAMIDLAQQRPINAVNLNTNGIRLATDKRFVAELGRRNRPGTPGQHLPAVRRPRRRRPTWPIRGRDLRETKQQALDNCAEAGLTVTLVAAIEKDLNEHEIGPIVRHGLAHPAVRSIAFQPVTHSGRHVAFDPLTRLTNSDVLHAIADQLPQWFTTSDFFPVPCCAPTCRSITYLLTQGHPDDPDFGLVPIPRLLQVEDYLDYVANRVVPDYDIREALEKLWSASAFVGTETNDDRLQLSTEVAEALDCADACGVNLPEALAGITDNAFMIVVQDFLDPYTLNVRQLMKCCVEEITPDGRLIPFCAYNSVGYREQVRAEQSGVAGRRRRPQRAPAATPAGGHPLRQQASHPDERRRWTPQTVKACCAAGYSSDLVSLLLGDSYHPGGLPLTRQLLDRVGARPPGSGWSTWPPGEAPAPCSPPASTAPASMASTSRRPTSHSPPGPRRPPASRTVPSSTSGDAEAVPLPDGCADAVVCECALCTFPDKPTAMAEMARLLVPGGRLGITDVAADRDRLPARADRAHRLDRLRRRRPPAGRVRRPGRLRRPAGADHGTSHRRAEPDDRPDRGQARAAPDDRPAPPGGARRGLRRRPARCSAPPAAPYGDGALDYVLLVAEKPCE